MNGYILSEADAWELRALLAEQTIAVHAARAELDRLDQQRAACLARLSTAYGFDPAVEMVFDRDTRTLTPKG